LDAVASIISGMERASLPQELKVKDGGETKTRPPQKGESSPSIIMYENLQADLELDSE